MNGIEDGMIPPEKSAAVARGLREAFGTEEWEDIRRLTKGNATSRVFRIVVRGTPYILKTILRADDATRHAACMESAARAGLAPAVRYAGVEDKVFITDFVEAAPFARAEALVRIPKVLRALHEVPPFPAAPAHLNTTYLFLMNTGPAVDGFVERFRAANLLPERESEELFARYAQIKAAYPHDGADMAPSHNDLFKPDNILFDGGRVWLVDWEAAFLNDRYADLAVVANMVAGTDAEEASFLREYFGEPPGDYRRARFHLAQQAAHLFYAMVFLSMGSAGKAIDWSESAPEPGEFRRRFWEGEIALKDAAAKVAYGRYHLGQFLRKTRVARFEEALRIVGKPRVCSRADLE